MRSDPPKFTRFHRIPCAHCVATAGAGGGGCTVRLRTVGVALDPQVCGLLRKFAVRAGLTDGLGLS